MGIWHHPDDLGPSRWPHAVPEGRLLRSEVQALACLQVREPLLEVGQHGLGVVLELKLPLHVPPQQCELVGRFQVALGFPRGVVVYPLWSDLGADARVEWCPLAWAGGSVSLSLE